MLTDDDAFEELTEYIPELNEVRRGDIVTELVTNKNETKENIGIITKADGTGSTDGIDVVWLRYGRLYVETSTLSEFGKNPNTIRCRRLLKKTDSAGTYEQAENWDVLDRVPVSAELETGSMSEENQASSERWRWIPNTGEYLVLERLSVQLKNRSGMKLKPVTGSSYSVTLKGAYDRNYDSTKTDEGNIYNNKAASFDVAFLDGDN
ncbi:MAG TPA: hypothetical protein DCL73_09825, partial [Treponema sp.]|nr:hypothetical protein [Treponema sp.]